MKNLKINYRQNGLRIHFHKGNQPSKEQRHWQESWLPGNSYVKIKKIPTILLVIFLFSTAMNYDVEKIRNQFPVLALHDKDPKPFAFLDSTATTQKPEFVIDAMDNFYRKHYSSIKR